MGKALDNYLEGITYLTFTDGLALLVDPMGNLQQMINRVAANGAKLHLQLCCPKSKILLYRYGSWNRSKKPHIEGDWYFH